MTGPEMLQSAADAWVWEPDYDYQDEDLIDEYSIAVLL